MRPCGTTIVRQNVESGIKRSRQSARLVAVHTVSEACCIVQNSENIVPAGRQGITSNIRVITKRVCTIQVEISCNDCAGERDSGR